MSNSTLIPPSPAEDEYVRAVESAAPLPLLPGSRSVYAVRGLAARGDGVGGQRPQRHDAVHRGRRGHARCAHGAAQGISMRGASSSTPISRAHKGRELLANPKAALSFHWKSLRRARCGCAATSKRSAPPRPTPISPAARGRRGSGRGASDQSRPMPDRFALEKRASRGGIALRPGRGPSAAELVRLSHRAALDGVLARPTVPPPRTPRRRARRRRLVDEPTLSLRPAPSIPSQPGVSPGCPLGAKRRNGRRRGGHTTLRAQWIRRDWTPAYDEAFGRVFDPR